MMRDEFYTDVKRFYYELVSEKGLQPNTVGTVHNTIHPALQLAVREEIIRINPSDGVMGELKRSKLWKKSKRHALTKPQQDTLMEYITTNREYAGWVPIITVLIGTGMRIGECLGLRWCDVDFKSRVISVNHNLSDRPVPGENRCERHIQTPKTEAGERTIPMIDEVFDAFLTEYQIQKCIGFCENETNLKVIQEVMGHADIKTTMDIYAEATEEKKKEVINNLQGKIF